jgi:hypothetical protein
MARLISFYRMTLLEDMRHYKTTDCFLLNIKIKLLGKINDITALLTKYTAQGSSRDISRSHIIIRIKKTGLLIFGEYEL